MDIISFRGWNFWLWQSWYSDPRHARSKFSLIKLFCCQETQWCTDLFWNLYEISRMGAISDGAWDSVFRLCQTFDFFLYIEMTVHGLGSNYVCIFLVHCLTRILQCRLHFISIVPLIDGGNVYHSGPPAIRFFDFPCNYSIQVRLFYPVPLSEASKCAVLVEIQT